MQRDRGKRTMLLGIFVLDPKLILLASKSVMLIGAKCIGEKDRINALSGSGRIAILHQLLIILMI